MTKIPSPARKKQSKAAALAVAVCTLFSLQSVHGADNNAAVKPAKGVNTDKAKADSSKSGSIDKSKSDLNKSGSNDKSKADTSKSGTIGKSKSDSTPSKGTPKMGWKLAMKVTYFGRVEWSVSEDGARLTSPMLSLVCRPPNYETNVYNTETHKMMTFTQKQGFDRIGMMMEGGLANRKKFQWSPWKKNGSEVIAGRKCDKYLRHLLNADQNATGYTTLEEEYWLAPFFDLPHMDELMAPLEKMTNRDFKLTKGFGIRRTATWKVFKRGNPVPLKVEPMTHLDTLELKRAPVDPKIFELGKGFTVVKDEGEIMFSDDGGSGLPGGFSGGF